MKLAIVCAPNVLRSRVASSIVLGLLYHSCRAVCEARAIISAVSVGPETSVTRVIRVPPMNGFEQ